MLLAPEHRRQTEAWAIMARDGVGLDNLEYKQGDLSYCDRVFALEEQSYPADEAATREGIEKRMKEAGRFFLLATLSNEVVGVVNGTLTASSSLTHETMSTHDPNGTLLCVHSVVVSPAHRRKGLALAMLATYLARLRDENAKDSEKTVKEVRLLCKENLKALYQKAGFDLVGISSVVHGKDQWFEMKALL